jgi:hypothetical protein
MSSTHEPSQLLEPSNLLEPLDLTERQLNFEYPSARSDRGGTSQRGSTRATRREFIPRPTEGRDRSPLKSILMVAGALACFGAGTTMPQFQTLVFGNLKSGQTVASAARPSSHSLADVAVKSDASKAAEPKSSESTSNPSNLNAAPDANGAVPPTANSADRNASAANQSAPVAKEAIAGCGVACDQKRCPEGDPHCLEGAAVNPPTPLTVGGGTAAAAGRAQPVRQVASPPPADSERADARGSSRQEERAQSSRDNRRAAPRDTADHQRARRNVATVSRSARGQERDTNQASSWRRNRTVDDEVAAASSWGFWQDRDADQRSSRAWDRAVDDNVPTARSSGRRQDRDADQRSSRAWDRAVDDNVPAARSSGRRENRDADQAASWRRDRYDEYPRGDDRRVFDRTVREDDRVIGRAKRDEGPLMTFPPARYRW